MRLDEVMILAGGLGTRLRPVISQLPKVLAPVLGKPFLIHIIEFWIKQGIKKFIICSGYKGNLIQEYILKTDYHNIVEFSFEKNKLGTGGAILNGLKLIKSDYFITQNGDTFIPLNLDILLQFNKTIANKIMFMTLIKETNTSRKPIFSIKYNKEIFYNSGKMNKKVYINGGIYIFNTKKLLLETYSQAKELSFENEILPIFIKNKEVIGSYFNKPFIDIGTPLDYKNAHFFMEKHIEL